MRQPGRAAVLAAFLTLVTACSSAPETTPATTTGEGAPEPAGTLTSLELDDAGTPRRYDLYVPPVAEQGGPLPAVVVLPGTTVSLDSLRETTGFNSLADTEGFLVAYVEAGMEGFDTRLCCGGTDRDVEFVLAVLAEVDRMWPVDPDRVYAAGFSAGAAMSYKLAVRAPDVFAAVAPVSGGFFPDPRSEAPQVAVPNPAPSLISFVGLADPDSEDYLAGLDIWRLGADCLRLVESEPAPGVQRRRSVCASSVVAVYVIADMGHAWPGGSGEAGFGAPEAPVSATMASWEFFADHPKA